MRLQPRFVGIIVTVVAPLNPRAEADAEYAEDGRTLLRGGREPQSPKWVTGRDGQSWSSSGPSREPPAARSTARGAVRALLGAPP